MSNDLYRRPIYATLYYAASVLLWICTALAVIGIVGHPDEYRSGAFGLTGTIIGVSLVGGGIAILLWGTGQIFDLLGKIEFNTRQPASDATLALLQEIARNTRSLPAPAPLAEDRTIYYYREKDGTEKGPFTRAELRTLLTAGRITPATRIDPELNGVREADVAVSDVLR